MDVNTLTAGRTLGRPDPVTTAVTLPTDARATVAAALATGDVKQTEPAEKHAPDGYAGPFFSPLVSYDALAKVPVMVFRDTQTGEVVNQIPSEQAVKKYRDQQMEKKQSQDASSILS